MEPILADGDFRFHIETILFYGVGWALDAAARGAEAALAAAALPPAAEAAARALLLAPKAVGLGLQAIDLLLMHVFSGAAAGAGAAATGILSAPFRLAAAAARAAAATLGALALLLLRGGAGAVRLADAIAGLGSHRIAAL